MKAFFRFLLGLSGAVIIRGFRFGFGEFTRTGYAGLAAVFPFQDRSQKEAQELYRSMPQISLDEILGDKKETISLRLQRHEDGMLGLGDAIVLLGILALEKPREILEIGTFMGHTTRRMAENLTSATIHTIDLPLDFSLAGDQNGPLPKDDSHLIKRRVVGREFKGQDCESRIVQHFGDTATMDFTKIGNPTFFFIDGAHTYEYCKQDTEKCLALCHGGETFLWHDCDEWHSDVVRFLLEWRALGRNIRRIEGTYTAYWKFTAQSPA